MEDNGQSAAQMPRRRIVMDLKVQADSVGDAARSLLEVVNWLDGLERQAGGAGRPVGEQAEVIADARRSASVVLDDDPLITAERYRLAMDRWRQAQDDAPRA
jgi:hypothetical protein